MFFWKISKYIDIILLEVYVIYKKRANIKWRIRKLEWVLRDGGVVRNCEWAESRHDFSTDYEGNADSNL